MSRTSASIYIQKPSGRKRRILKVSPFTKTFEYKIIQDINGVKDVVYEGQVQPQVINRPPSVDAGAIQTVLVGTVGIKLDGTVSDSDGTIASTEWKQVTGIPVILTQDPTNTEDAIFDAPTEETDLTFELTAIDDKGAFTKDLATVRVKKEIPPPPEPSSEVDQFGIAKLFPDAPSGKFFSEVAEEVKIRNYPDKPSEWSYEAAISTDTPLVSSETTFYVKINDFKVEDDTLSLKLARKSGGHQDGKGAWYIFQISIKGKDDNNLETEVPHPKYFNNNQKILNKIGQDLVGKWIGFKAIVVAINGGADLHLASFFDFPVEDINNVPNKWTPYIAVDDEGQLKGAHLVSTTGTDSTLRIDGVQKANGDKGIPPEVKYASIREIIFKEGPDPEPTPTCTDPNAHFDKVLGTCVCNPKYHMQDGVCVQDPEPTGELDIDGVRVPFFRTGKMVKLTTGNDHRNGQRYSVNHNFKNYFTVGYFKLGKGQVQIELKTDGANHSGCTSLPCCWLEPDLVITNKTLDNGVKVKTGDVYISSEFPHPVNHPPNDDQVIGQVEGVQSETWIGFAVAAFENPEGFRRIMVYADTNPFDAEGKPLNNWQLAKDEVDRGQITTPELAKRKIPIDANGGRGLEAEIRMHGATNHDCEIKMAKVYEILPL